MNIFAENLKTIRLEKGITQKALAEAIGVSDDCIFFWEKKRSEPSIDEIILLAQYFDVTTDYLLGISEI